MIQILLSFFIGLLLADGDKPWLGVAIDEHKDGVLVKRAIEGTPAFKAGIRAQDVIFKINETPLKTTDDLIQKIRDVGVGKSVKVFLYRDKRTVVKNLELVAKPSALEMSKNARIGKAVPKISAISVDEKKLKLTKGESVVILKFWATWCPNCRRAIPVVEKFMKNKKVRVIALSDEKKKVVKKFLAKKKKSEIEYYLYQKDLDFYVQSVPFFVLLDKDLIVREISIGAGSELEKFLTKAEKLIKD